MILPKGKHSYYLLVDNFRSNNKLPDDTYPLFRRSSQITLGNSLYSFNDVAAYRFVDTYSKSFGKSNPALAKIDRKVFDWDLF